MAIVDDIADMTVRIEQETETRQEVYNLLLLALLEIRRQNHRIAVLESKVKTNDDYFRTQIKSPPTAKRA